MKNLVFNCYRSFSTAVYPNLNLLYFNLGSSLGSASTDQILNKFSQIKEYVCLNDYFVYYRTQ